jgi:hypothetical protein
MDVQPLSGLCRQGQLSQQLLWPDWLMSQCLLWQGWLRYWPQLPVP